MSAYLCANVSVVFNACYLQVQLIAKEIKLPKALPMNRAWQGCPHEKQLPVKKYHSLTGGDFKIENE